MLSMKLTDVLNRGELKHFRIPNFQREYVWKYSNTEKLIDSMIRQFPIGSFLLLNCGNPTLTLNYLDLNIEQKAFKNSVPDPQENECVYVLDGQQRITSLLRAFFNVDKDRYYCLDLNVLYSMFKKIDDDENLIISFKNSAKFKIEKKNKIENFKYLPLEELINESNKKRDNMITEFIENNAVLFLDKSDTMQFFSYCISIFTELRNYAIPIQLLDNKTTLESIVRIFETINNSGIKLSVFDLMVAKTFLNDKNNKDKNFNLREKLTEIQEGKYLKNLQGETLLNAILYSHQIDNIDDDKEIYVISTKTTLLSLSREDINKNLLGIVLSFESVEKWFIDNRIKSNSQMLNIKLMLSVCEFKYKIISDLCKNKDFNKDLKKLVLFRAFDDKTYNRGVINHDISMFRKIYNGKNFKEEFKLSIKYKEIKIEELLAIKKSLKEFNPFMCIFNENNLYDLYNEPINHELSEDHHIIPEALIRDTFDEHDKIYILKDSIANAIWTTKDTNNEISKNDPEKYFSIIVKKNSLNDNERNFKNGYIPISADNISSIRGFFSNRNSYIDFINERAKLLTNCINKYYEEYLEK